MGDSSRTPNRRLNHYKTRAGLTHAELARAVRHHANAQGINNICPDGSRVRRWLEGEQPREPIPRILADIFSQRLGTPVDPTDLGLAGTRPGTDDETIHIPWLLTRAVSSLGALVKGDLMLDHPTPEDTDPARLTTGADLIAAVHPWANATPEPLPNLDHSGHGRVGTADITQIEHITAVFRTWDNRYGGGLSRETIIGHLKSAVALLDGPYTEKTGRALFRAVADLASVAGWASFDTGIHPAAQRYFTLGLHAAKEAGDRALGAHILNCMSRQMGHLHRPDDALELVQLALYGARNTATATTRAMLYTLEARYHAVLGHHHETTRALGLAEDAYAHTDPANDPTWVHFFDPSEYYATTGVCHYIAAHTDPTHPHLTQAAHLIEQAITHRPCDRVRSRAFDHIALARTYLLHTEYEAATTATSTALTLLGNLRSQRVTDRLRELHTETHHPNNPALRDLHDHLTTAIND